MGKRLEPLMLSPFLLGVDRGRGHTDKWRANVVPFRARKHAHGGRMHIGLKDRTGRIHFATDQDHTSTFGVHCPNVDHRLARTRTNRRGSPTVWPMCTAPPPFWNQSPKKTPVTVNRNCNNLRFMGPLGVNVVLMEEVTTWTFVTLAQENGKTSNRFDTLGLVP